jgi:hypothetical protein
VVSPWPSAAGADEHLPHLPLVSYEAFDYGYKGPTRLDAGQVQFEIVNTGKEPHQIQIVKLGQKHTAADFAAAIKADPTHLPAWGSLMGGPNGTVPGSRASTLQVLVPGEYVLVCWMPDAKGVPHLTLGMTKSVTVGGAPKPEAEIVPDITVTMTDFAYGLSKPIRAGTYTMEVINRGKQVHEALVVKLPPGGSVKAYGEALTPGKVSSGSPPGTPMGGVVGLAPGGRAFVTQTFTPGRYGLICLFPDHATGTPHFAKGMAHEFEVE